MTTASVIRDDQSRADMSMYVTKSLWIQICGKSMILLIRKLKKKVPYIVSMGLHFFTIRVVMSSQLKSS